MWLLVMPGFIWGFPIHAPGWCPIQDVHRRSHRLAPKHGRHAHAFEETPRHFDDGLVSALNNTVLLRGVWRGGEMLDVVLVAECIELSGVELTSSIRTESKKFALLLCLGTCLDLA
jgi:hypothetical protein